MKIIYLTIFVLINFYCKYIIAQNIVVINIQSLIDKNDNYIKVIKELENTREKYFVDFEKRESDLKKTLNNIEESKLILSENEINNKIDIYNKQLNDFSNNVDDFNFFYQNQIINMREAILKEIIILLEKFAIENNIDLILDSTSYLIASNSIDITDNIDKELKKINIKLEYKDFENN